MEEKWEVGEESDEVQAFGAKRSRRRQSFMYTTARPFIIRRRGISFIVYYMPSAL